MTKQSSLLTVGPISKRINEMFEAMHRTNEKKQAKRHTIEQLMTRFNLSDQEWDTAPPAIQFALVQLFTKSEAMTNALETISEVLMDDYGNREITPETMDIIRAALAMGEP